MKNNLTPRSVIIRATGKRVVVVLYVILFALGLGYIPAVAAASSIPIGQQPLIVRPTIPPNIVLMLDDSGSMAWDVMPDYDYLADKSPEALIDSAINGAYYNPVTTYVRPPKADGTLYPQATFTAALVNGFDPTSKKVDLSRYTGDYDTSTSGGPSRVQYSVQVVAGNYSPQSCSDQSYDGASGKYPGFCYDTNNDGKTYEFYDDDNGDYYHAQCNTQQDYYDSSDNKCLTGGTVVQSCSAQGYDDVSGRYLGYCYDNDDDGKAYAFSSDGYYYAYVCPDPSDIYKQFQTYSSDKNGSVTTTTVNECYTGYSFFTYTTTDTSGNYVRHYVAKDPVDCTAAGLSSDVCDGTVATQQNVANWFSYYHTRILLAKSGLMRAFNNLNPTYRFGYGSINKNGTFPSGIDTFTFDDYTSGGGSTYNKLAEVAPFGSATDTADRRHEFWTWMAGTTTDDAGVISHSGGISPSGNTPLRKALDGVGKYYQTVQPWQSKDPSTGTTQELACRQSYTILTTDGFWNGSSPQVGNQDGNGGDKIQNPNGQAFTYIAADPYSDSRSSTLADVAMKYWKNDLQSGIDNEVPVSTADKAFWQHMVTFTLGMGFTPSDADGNPIKSDTVQKLLAWAQADDTAGNGKATKPASLTWGGWPKPSSNSINNIADMVHAAVNGHGGFYSATNPDSFVSGVETALARATARVGSGSGVAANSTQLQNGTAMVYQARYNSFGWSGGLLAYPISSSGLSKTESWNAADEMPAPADRDIQTWNPATKAMVAFKNSGPASPPTGLPNDELTALGADAANQAKIVDWMRGSHADEESHTGGTLRTRIRPVPTGQKPFVLGDIVNSQPVYVGKVDPNQFTGRAFTGSDSFTQYANDQLTRSPRLYVAANDGMLHAFDAASGAETFAFLPAAVITNGIAKTAQPDYGKNTNPHQFFNDGQLTVADAYFAEGSDPAAWHSVLVGTTGRGPVRAVYALDVTDPDDVKVLWERSASDGKANSGYIGQITGKPIIAQVADASGNDTWVVLIGNGYNSAKDTAALLQFNLQTGALDVHTAGTATGNGLATPAVWLSQPSTGLSDVAYAGDLLGNVWKFPLVTYGTDANGNGNVTGTPDATASLVYVAKDASGNRQPITAGMLIGMDPKTSDLWLFFGTGRYLASSDLTDTSVQTWYGLVVATSGSSTMTAVSSTSTRGDLAKRKVIAETAGSSVTKDGVTTVTSPTRIVSLAHDIDANTPTIDDTSGWYIDLLAPTAYTPVGERMIIPTQFDGSMILGTSIVPKSNDVCNPSGTSWLNRIDPFTGTNPRSGGFDVNHDGVIDSADMVTITITGPDGKPKQLSVVASSIGTNSMANSTTNVGRHGVTSLTNGELLDILKSGADGNITRVSWREMVNP